MSDRAPRWNWLAVFVVANLVCWVMVAATIGVLASSVVDLGVESFLREGQATLLALGEQAPTRSPSSTPWAVSETDLATRSATATPVEERRATARVEPSPSMAAAVPRVQVTPAVTQNPSPATDAVEEPVSQPTVPASSNPVPVAPQPTSIAASGPILLADPSLEALLGLDAEIRRSDLGRPAQIRYGEAALNQEIASLLSRYPSMPYRNIYADLERDRIVLTGDVEVIGFEVPAEVEGRVVARDCQPEVEIESVSIGGLLTPRLVKDQVVVLVQESLDWYPANYPLCLEQIVLEEDHMTIYGSRR